MRSNHGSTYLNGMSDWGPDFGDEVGGAEADDLEGLRLRRVGGFPRRSISISCRTFRSMSQGV